ncbi:MAG TPA: HsdR family type I site-specific deoxyribonuclease [Actinophytocola sp.]|uniref:type I restriction endonuclease subunit R n=1 Tax=Actinophytocola sp. TaxID=1872138 RepID=UPI002E0506C0|nr:HsdR family type I site-specific deoxyribonuclease [Actinophytocola sp.]
MQPERDEVERPLIDQLVAMGWTHLRHAGPGEYTPGSDESGRQTYVDVVLLERFREALRNINVGPDGQPWLDGDRIGAIVNQVVRDPEAGVLGNIAFTELLTGSELTVPGLPDWNGGVRQPVRLVDWEHPDRNDLLVVSQFRIDTPDGPNAYVVPDLVLFVNGLPLAVIECKDPGPTAVDDAVTQLLGYAGAGRATAVRDLTRFVQLLVGTDREGARYGTITSSHEHFAPWRLVDRNSDAVIRDEVAKPADQPLLAQEILAGEMLRPAVLLELIRDYTVGHSLEGRTIKIVARWQQYRAVRRMIARLLERQRAVTTSTVADHRGGVTWHTQGSGKSLTMTFLVRVLRGHEELRGFKVVVVTDRLDLEDQILQTLGSTGQTPRRATSVDDAHDHLARATPDLVLVTIQKSQRDEDLDDGTEEALDGPAGSRLNTRLANDSNEIVVLVDEAHRSQDAWLHARLRAKLPHAVLIGFTGTPILRGRRKRTEDIFGPMLDIYTLKDAERDGTVVPLRYESREAPAELIDRAILDARFLAAVPEGGPERAAAIDQFARRQEVLEAEDLIRAKAEDMLRHWVRNALPDRFSAQVVAVSRKAAVRYRRALLEARDRLLAAADDLPAEIRHDPLAWDEADEETQLLLTTLQNRALLSRITVVSVISKGTTPDDPDWALWTDRDRHRDHISRFKQGLGEVMLAEPDAAWSDLSGELRHRHPIHDGGGDPWDGRAVGRQAGTDAVYREGAPAEPIAFIVVRSMLLTGFDAPVEQILYVDREMKSVELLQAIARPNRPRKYKEFGLVVDYVAISAKLAQALADYDPDHLTRVVGDALPSSIMAPLDQAVVPELREQHQNVMRLLAGRGIQSLSTAAEREELLAQLDDPELRALFDDITRTFLSALNAVLPRPEALAYRDIARQLGTVQYLARRRYRDSRVEFSPYRYGAKIRQLIDAHIRAEGVVQRIPPVEITASDFAEKVDALPDDRARALEMKHALREHLSTRMGADPVTYQRLSERLEEILRELEEEHDYGQAVLDLLGLRNETLVAEYVAAEHDLDRWTERPIHSLLERLAEELPEATVSLDLVWVARDLATRIGAEVGRPNFLYNHAVREQVRRRWLKDLVEEKEFPPDAARRTADELLALATNNRERFLRLHRESP